MTDTISRPAVRTGLAALGGLALLAACGNKAAEPDRESSATVEDKITVENTQKVDDQPFSRLDQRAEAPERLTNHEEPPTTMAADDDLLEMPLSDGQWFIKENQALFGPPVSEAFFTLSCEPGGEILITRSIALEDDEQRLLRLHTDEASADGMWRDASDVTPLAEARFRTSDDIFEKIVNTSRFAVEAEGERLLVLPVTERVRDTIYNCR
jgi:hypothetical protein